MPRPRTPKLTKLDLLDLALEGAQTRLGLNMGNPDFMFDEESELRAWIKEIQKRIKLCQIATARKESQS